MLSPALLEAYRATHYQVRHPSGSFTLHVDQPSAELAHLLRESGQACAAFLTACNPYSLPLGETENAAAQQRLVQELRQAGFDPIPAIGLDPSGAWQGEESFLVLGLGLSEARAIGTRYAQNAIIWAAADAIPRLIMLV